MRCLFASIFCLYTRIPQNSGRAEILSRILQRIGNGLFVAFSRVGFGPRKSMTLKIERIAGKRKTRIRLSGQIRAEHLDQLKAEMERAGPQVVLDLDEVDLVDIEGVRFLNTCEADGVSVLHCSPYVREWMFRERLAATSKRRL